MMAEARFVKSAIKSKSILVIIAQEVVIMAPETVMAPMAATKPLATTQRLKDQSGASAQCQYTTMSHHEPP